MKSCRRNNGKKVRGMTFARRTLAGVFSLAFLFATGCGNTDMDPLVPPTEISYSRQEGETVTVEKGDLTPTFKTDIELSGYKEDSYSLVQGKVDEMEALYDAKMGEVLVSEGDKVVAGQTMLTFESEVLDEKNRQWSNTKNVDALEREHLSNLQAIEGSQEYSNKIEDLYDDILIANQYISDINNIYSSINIIADSDGVVSYVNESARSGSVVVGAPIIKVTSDDGYYVLNRSNLESQSEEGALKSGIDIDFNVGDTFKAKYALNEYEVEVIEEPTGNASSGDASSSDMIYFKLVNDELLKDKVLTITKELPEVKNVCYVSRRAIVIYNDETYVYKQMEDGSFRAVKVVTGEAVGLDVVIKEGVEEGDVLSIPE